MSAKMKPPKASPPDALFARAADEHEWKELSPGSAARIVDLWGDHERGAYAALFKFPAGYATPLHTHTYDMHILVISGTLLQIPEGKPAIVVGPGGYLLQPGGEYRHVAACGEDSECVFFAESDGYFDLLPVDPHPSPRARPRED